MTSIDDNLADLYLLSSQHSNLHPAMDVPNNFVDPDELLVDAENETDSVVNINADSDGEPPLRADDCESALATCWLHALPREIDQKANCAGSRGYEKGDPHTTSRATPHRCRRPPYLGDT